tara:strand:- start:15312 stop:16829 length:1518 start_codon:yes stop_codon:yes gene_type:complete
MIAEELEKHGGLLSTELKDFVMKKVGVSQDTARKRISRALLSDSNICKLNGLNFKNNINFYYHRSNFGSPKYWDSLFHALQSTNSIYSYAIAALRTHNGLIPSFLFPVKCGAPYRMAKNLSFEKVLNDLKLVNIIREDEIKNVGHCVSLMQKDSFVSESGIEIKGRLLAEKIYLGAISDWLRKLNIASYESITNNRVSKVMKPVNGFYWDLTAPSFLSPLTQHQINGGKQTGFVVCDVDLGVIINEISITPFLNKVKKSQNNKNQSKCLYILAAEHFTDEAFQLARKEGIIPATPRNLFGKDIEEALKEVINVFSQLSFSITQPEQIGELFNKLQNIEGAVGNLRGSLFEFIVAEALRCIHPNVTLGQKFKAVDSKKKYDADIVVTKPNEIFFIECKGGNPYQALEHAQVKHWLQDQVPNIFKSVSGNDDFNNNKTSLVFELWSTQRLDEKSLKLISEAKTKINKKKYTIDIKVGCDVRKELAYASNDKLLHLIDQHFLRHPFKK